MIFYAAVFMWFIGLNLCSSILLGTPRDFGGYGLHPTSVGIHLLHTSRRRDLG